MRDSRTSQTPQRAEEIKRQAVRWSARRRCGFTLPPAGDPSDENAPPDGLRVDGYRVLRPPRPRKAGQMRIGVLDFDGVLTVTDPQRFLAALAAGFGRAKAYGCGLMLIARVTSA
jgi:CRISPR system Cascade subunit CasE